MFISSSCENGKTKEKCVRKDCSKFRQITFFRVSRVPKQWTGIFKVSNTWTVAAPLLGFLAAAMLWRRDGSAEPSRESLQRLFTGEWSFVNKRSGAIGVGGFARDNSRRGLSKIAE